MSDQHTITRNALSMCYYLESSVHLMLGYISARSHHMWLASGCSLGYHRLRMWFVSRRVYCLVVVDIWCRCIYPMAPLTWKTHVFHTNSVFKCSTKALGWGVFLAIVFQDYSWIRLESYFYAVLGGCMLGTHIRALCKPAHQWGAVTCFSFLVNWSFKIVCMGWGTCRGRGTSAKWWRYRTFAHWLTVHVPHSLVHAGTLGLACRMHLRMES